MNGELAIALIRESLTVSVAVLLVLALRLPTRKIGGPAVAYGLWALVPLAAVIAFLPGPPEALGMVRPIQIDPALIKAVAQQTAPAAAGAASDHAAAAAAPGRGFSVPWLALWFLGAGLLALRLFWLEARLARNLTGIRPDPAQKDVFYVDGDDVGPMVVGLWRAKIILPGDFSDRYAADERQLILAHERAHVRGGHLIAGAFAYLVLIVQWFNPLAWAAFKVFRADQELACDAMVVAAYPQQRSIYARAMFKTGLAQTNAPLAYGWSANPVRRRIAMLKFGVPGRLRRLAGGAVALVSVCSGSLMAYAAVPGTATATAKIANFTNAVLDAVPTSKVSPRVAAPRPSLTTHATTTAPATEDYAAARNALLEEYYTLAPEARGRFLDLAKAQATLGDEKYQQLLAADLQVTVQQRALVFQSPDNPFSFEVRTGVSRTAAAQAVGLADANGYGVDTATISSEGSLTMVRCHTPATPLTARCA